MCQFGEDYRLADYYYIKSFCFGTMEDWDISEVTGEVIDGQEPVSLVRFKLYPYVLFGCAVLGKSKINVNTYSTSTRFNCTSPLDGHRWTASRADRVCY